MIIIMNPKYDSNLPMVENDITLVMTQQDDMLYPQTPAVWFEVDNNDALLAQLVSSLQQMLNTPEQFISITPLGSDSFCSASLDDKLTE